MGAPQLKAKRDLNYRRKSASRSCADCNHFVDAYTHPYMYANPRCRIIGQLPGRAYRISPNGLCDKHDNSEYMKRLKARTRVEEELGRGNHE